MTTPEGNDIDELNLPDLETARQIISFLRRHIKELQAEIAPLDNEHVVFLNPEAMGAVRQLYHLRLLCSEQRKDPELDFEDAFESFVHGAIELHYETYVGSLKEHTRTA